MPDSYKNYIKQMKSAESLEELQKILGEAIHDKSVNAHDQIDAVIEAMDQREKKLGINSESE